MVKFVDSATTIEVEDVAVSEASCRETLSRGVAVDRAIKDQDYGCRDFDLRDPDGQLIGLGQNLTKQAG